MTRATEKYLFNCTADTREESTIYGPIVADFLSDQVLCVEDKEYGSYITLNVSEGRALRDYLNKVLPWTKEPMNCRDAGPGRGRCIECANGNYERCLYLHPKETKCDLAGNQHALDCECGYSTEPGDDAPAKAATPGRGTASAPEARASVARGSLSSKPQFYLQAGSGLLNPIAPDYDVGRLDPDNVWVPYADHKAEIERLRSMLETREQALRQFDRQLTAHETSQNLGPREPNNDMVICPACTCQFVAIPVNVQQQLRGMGKAGDNLAHQSIYTPFHERWWQARGGHDECTVCVPESPEETSERCAQCGKTAESKARNGCYTIGCTFAVKASTERCGNWPCQLPIYHLGPCRSSPNGNSDV